MTKYEGWWTDPSIRLPEIQGHTAITANSVESGLIHCALFRGGAVRTKKKLGRLKGSLEELQKAIVDQGGRLLLRDFNNDDESAELYVWPAGYFFFNSEFGNPMWAANDEVTWERCVALGAFFEPSIPQTVVKIITASSNGLDATTLAVEPTPLERDNYSDEVLKAYDHVVKDLQSSSPCGRITLLNGVPGTGKTYVVRSLLHGVEKGQTYVIPSNMVSDLSSPQFMTLLLNERSNVNGPMLFILEDADAAVTSRELDNVASVSTLLNLSDGRS
jgi:hypothetical protein